MTDTQIKARGKVTLKVPRHEALPKWQQNALATAIKDGKGASNDLRFTCLIANVANEAFEHLVLPDGERLTLNPKAKAQFGRNHQGNAFLTVGLVRESGERIRLHWEGEAVPQAAKVAAVKHDSGKLVQAKDITFDLSKATVWKLGEKGGVKRNDRRKNHDTNKTGKPYARKPRRNHDRLCSTDLR